MKTMTKYVVCLLLAAKVLAACHERQEEMAEQNAVYYWRTELRLDSTERDFLRQYHITKVYCRYFDVVMDDGEPMPNATITFRDTLPQDIEMVPTVFITEDCMHEPHPGLAEKLVKRILQMNETHDIAGVREIQIDCDYTARSRQTYYDFLNEINSALTTHPLPLTLHLSTTIRLHQLAMPAPPVDYGVLMVYNTGDPQRFMERRSADGRVLEEGKNPILDIRDVQPYLHYLADYKLPMGAAYPVFQWTRTISGVQIVHNVKAPEVLRVKQAIESERPDLRRTILTYHLDRENIERYKPRDYEEIYRH